MAEFMLEPEDIEPERPARGRAGPVVRSGLHPLSAVPSSRQPASSPSYAPCAVCGLVVLTGKTSAGTALALEPTVATYVVDWEHGTAVPRLTESRGYPVHRCPGVMA